MALAILAVGGLFPSARAAEDIDALVSSAAQCYRVGQYDQAAATLTRATQFAPARADLWYRCGVARLQQRSFDAALRDLQRAVQLDATLGPAWNALGATQYGQAAYSAALLSLDRALALRAGDPEANLNRGLVCLEQGDISGAEQSLQRSAQFAPGEPRLSAALARLQKKKTDAETRRQLAAQNPAAGLNELFANLASAQQAVNELRDAAQNRNVSSALNGLGRLGGMLANRAKKPAAPPPASPAEPRGPFALDDSGRIAPAASFDLSSAAPPTSVPGAPTSAKQSPEATAIVSPVSTIGSEPPSVTPPPPPAPDVSSAATPGGTPFAVDEAAIRQLFANLARALEGKNLDQAAPCFVPTIQGKIRDAFGQNPDRMPQLATLLPQAKVSLLSDENPVGADGITRTAEITISTNDRTMYLQLAKTGGMWLVSSI